MYKSNLLTCFILFYCVSCAKPLKDISLLTLNDLSHRISEEEGKSKISNKNQYLHLAQAATLCFYGKEYKKAALLFEKAWLWQDSHFTKSVSNLGLSKIYNDTALPFRGHYLERYQLRILAGLNQLKLNKKEASLIEFRRLSREIRLENDPFWEKRSLSSLQHYGAFTGLMLLLLGREDEGYNDLLFSYNLKPENFPRYLKDKFLELKNSREGAQAYINSKNGLVASLKKINLKVNLSRVRKNLTQNKISLTMLDYWPSIQTESQGEKNYSEMEDVFTGVFGRRLLSISYPIPSSETIAYKNNKEYLDFNFLFYDSWASQKNRLIRSTLTRVATKIIASEMLVKKINQQDNLGLDFLLGNISRALIWKTENADLRTISYLPSLIKIHWEWVGDKDSFTVNWKE